MLKQHIKTATPYLLSVLLFCLVVWIVDSSQLFQSCVSEGKNNAGDEALQNKVSVFVSEFWVYRRCLGIYVIERNAGITALFTVVLAVSTILLWIVTNKAAKAAQAAAEHIPIVEGAFVYVLLVADLIGDQLDVGSVSQPLLQIRLKNFGKTPAFIDRFSAHLICVGLNKRGREVTIQPNTIIGAGEEWPVAPISLPIEMSLSAEEVTKIKDRSTAILLNGTLLYSDIWECQWDAPFDGRYDAETESFRIDNYTQRKNEKRRSKPR
jgi:hypothetical protein